MHVRTMGKRTLKDTFRFAIMLIISIITTCSTYAQSHSIGSRLLAVGDTLVYRVMPKPISDSIYVATDYTEIHFRVNKADLDIDYMDNGYSLLHLDRVIDSLGIENISAIEIISQSSPEGSLERNTWLTEHRSKVMMEYMDRVFPQLKNRGKPSRRMVSQLSRLWIPPT